MNNAAKLILLCTASLAWACQRPKDRTRFDILDRRVDTSASPRADFFQYANGAWIRGNPIPDEQSAWGIADLVIEENQQRLRDIAEAAARVEKAREGSPERLIGDFWKTAIDSSRTAQDGLNALQPLLDSIRSMTTTGDIARIAVLLRSAGTEVLFDTYVGADARNSEMNALQYWQGGLGLPERDYYLKSDSASLEIRSKYLLYVARLLEASGSDSTAAHSSAQNILALETRMATASRPMEKLRDADANYHKMTRREWAQLLPALDWNAWYAGMAINAPDSVIVGQPEFFSALDRSIRTTSMDTWKAYFSFHLLHNLAFALPERFAMASFDFGRTFSGAKVRKPRWKRVIQSTESALGEWLGRLYVKTYFNAETRKRYEGLVEEIRIALKERIAGLNWMSDSTRQRAYAKLNAMKKKVGYPDQWKDFSSMQIDTISWVRNVMAANHWWDRYEIGKIGKPVDRTEWDMYPQTYNAYYNASNNEIVLPAGIFTVPGLKDEELDDATVYGYAAASTIGHEIIHGFDDEGRKFDDKGNLINWWTQRDESAFQTRAERIIRQFDAIQPLPGLHINGRATTGENIADLGGVILGLHAYRKTREYKEGKPIGGFTPIQRYFMGYALGWLEHKRDEALRNQVLTDYHAPARYRINGPLANLPEFHEAFGVKPGDPMYMTDSLRVRIW